MSSSSHTYDEALARLAQLQSNRTIVNLFEPSTTNPPADLNALAIPEMVAWLGRAGYTPADLAAAGLRCVHVAGTKGKGSVSTLVASILRQYTSASASSFSSSSSSSSSSASAAGPAVGTYTSPHLVSVRERILLDGRPIPRGLFARYFFEVWDRLTQAAKEAGDKEVADGDHDGPATKPFYFRFLTILALHVFVREGVRSAVVECGIGAEYDSTNVLPAEAVTAAVVTQLGVDHVAMLGDTVEKIAWHKAGVFKKGVRGFTRRLEGGEGEGVMRVLRERAREKGVKELVEVCDGDVERWKGVEGARLEGPFQKRNMALAVAAAREHLMKMGVRFEGSFGEEGYALDEMPAEFERGLREAELRGRCEVYKDGEGVEWFIDGAHTVDSIAGVGQWFAGKSKSSTIGDSDGVRVLLFNQQERDPTMLLGALLTAANKEAGAAAPAFTHAIFTRNEETAPTKDEPERDLAVQTKGRDTLQTFGSGTEAVILNAVQPSAKLIRNIARQAKKDDKTCKVLVTGSFHLVGAVLKTIDHVEY
ncbi:Mur ligase [Bombardia bombarda]|uniref:Folylpolyglutamate synthase n=1 Tax=Bombardia bombarda TaxID=252184 RepID=A0AA40C9J7_9PEZI|nr:Mur ligase [Bombardia bombarda]